MDQQTPMPAPAVDSVQPKPAQSSWRNDILTAAAIGEICAWLLFPIVNFLELEIPYYWTGIIVLPVLCAGGMALALWIGQKIKFIYQLAKFGLVGVFNTLVDWGVLNALMYFTGISQGIGYSSFKGASFLVAVCASYFWNKFWTFKRDNNRLSGKEFIQFIVVSVIGFAINVGAATLLVNYLGPQFGTSDRVWAEAGALAGTLLGLCWNFLGYKLIVFKS